VTDDGWRGLPEDKRTKVHRVRRLQWLTVIHVLAAAVVLYIALGSSQAMKAAWLDDMVGLFPPVAYLLALRYEERPPSKRFPYGFHRAQSIAFFWAAVALIGLGLFIFIDSVFKLVQLEHPTIGNVELFGRQIWLGWLMLPALAFSGVPQWLLARAKLPLAHELNDKVLHADAAMNRADWLAAGAAAIGVVGIAFGIWWLDSAAAVFIAIEITEEGVKHMRGVFFQLLGERPTTVDYERALPLGRRIETRVREFDWVSDARVRLREEGRVFFGEVFVETADAVKPSQVRELTRTVHDMDWRIREVMVTPVPDLDVDSELKGPED
jgi:cation diffusion facilitator family transporter